MLSVPSFFDGLVAHLQTEERQRMLSSLAVMVSPELWLSSEAAAFLDTNRPEFDLAEPLDSRPNVPRWLVAAERGKVDLWVADQREQEPSIAIEFKVLHNNKNFYTKVWEIRRDLDKTIPIASADDRIERWGIVMLVFSRFYDDQAGSYRYLSDFKEHKAQLKAFADGLKDDSPWYGGVPRLKLMGAPALLCQLEASNYIDSSNGQQSNVHLALVRPIN